MANYGEKYMHGISAVRELLSEAVSKGGYLTQRDISSALSENGSGVNPDSIIWMLLDIGIMIFSDDADAAGYVIDSARQGDIYAMRRIGDMYRDGTGVKKDESEYLKWYRSAAEHGDTEAQKRLVYETADGDEDCKWLRMAAEHGDIEVLKMLGCHTDDGDEAIRWYRIAAARGDAESMRRIGEIYMTGYTPEDCYYSQPTCARAPDVSFR